MEKDPTGLDIKFDPTIQRMSGRANHGDTPFDVPFISEVAENLWQGGCQDGLELPVFFQHVVSLYPWERYHVRRSLDSFLEVRMYDSEDQGYDQVIDIAKWVNKCRETGPTLVHCQAGLNRSSLVAATALSLSGLNPQESIDLLREKRSPAVLCNPSFTHWLLEDFDYLKERNEDVL